MTLIRISAKRNGRLTIKAFTEKEEAWKYFDQMKDECSGAARRNAYEVSVNTRNGERVDRMAWTNGNSLEMICLEETGEILDAALTK